MISGKPAGRLGRDCPCKVCRYGDYAQSRLPRDGDGRGVRASYRGDSSGVSVSALPSIRARCGYRSVLP
jgi:hypothetical protein